jgi:hypothetical protein
MKLEYSMLKCGDIDCKIYRVHHFKRNPTTITYYGRKMKSEAGPPRVIEPPNLPVTLESKPSLLLGRVSCQLRKSCADANMMYSRAERYFASKLAVGEELAMLILSRKYQKIHRLVTNLGTQGVCVSSRRWWTSAVKLFCSFFVTNNIKKQLVCLVILVSLKLTNTAVVRVAF